MHKLYFVCYRTIKNMLDRFLKSHTLTPQNEKVTLLINKTSPNAFLQHIPAHNVGYCYHFEMATVTTKTNSIGCLEWPGIYSQSQNQQGIQSREHSITVLRYVHTALAFQPHHHDNTFMQKITHIRILPDDCKNRGLVAKHVDHLCGNSKQIKLNI